MFLDQSIPNWCLWLRTTCTIYGLLHKSYLYGSLIVMSLSTRSKTLKERCFWRPWFGKLVLARCGIMKTFLVCTDWLLTYISLRTLMAALAGALTSMSCAQNTIGWNCRLWRIPEHFMFCPTCLLGMYRITLRR